jgi:hypothetical protein
MMFRPSRKHVVVLAVIAATMLVWRLVGHLTSTMAGPETVAAAEQRVRRLHNIVEGMPGNQRLLERVSSEHSMREDGVLDAPSAPLAYAQLWGILCRVNDTRKPPIEFGGVEFGGKVARLSDEYGEIEITVPFSCRMDQLTALLLELPRQREIIATKRIDISSADEKQKTLNVRLTVSGVVRGDLATAKAGSS